MSRRALRWCVLAASLLVWSSGVRAQQEAVARGACAPDVERLCAGVQPGHGRIATCLMDKQAELSPECTQQIEQMRARARAFAQACKGDIQKHCKGMGAGSSKLAKCLRENQAKLTPACKEAFAP